MGYADFCSLVDVGGGVTLAISGVTGLNVSKIVHDVEKFILFYTFKSELQYCNPFWNVSVTNEIGPQNADMLTLIGCHGNVP